MDVGDVAQRMMALFRGLDGVHGTHGVPNREGLKSAIKKTARTIREPVTIELWIDHLEGKKPLGVVPIMENGDCWWGSIDVDDYAADLPRIIQRVEALKFPLVPVRSKSGGLHLFLFTKEPVPAVLVQNTLRDMAASLGLAGSEIFPKQTTLLTERGDAGSWMVMPYFGDTFEGRLQEQVGLKRTGMAMLVEEFLRIAEGMRVTISQIEAIQVKRPAPPQRHGAAMAEATGVGGLFSDGPRCLEIMAREGFPEGGRNNALFHMAIYLKRSMGDGDAWKGKLHDHNRELMIPPLTRDEVDAAIHSLEKRDYDYTCKAEPMCSHCDVVMCRGRRFGVGVEGDYPIISGITKLDIPEDPTWFIDIEQHRIDMNTDQLYDFRLFAKVCLERINRMYRPMSPKDWQVVVTNAMANLEILEPSPDLGPDARFHEMLEEFLTNRARGHRAEDLFAGLPWHDEDKQRHLFRMMDLMKFLMLSGQRNVIDKVIAKRVEKLGGHKYVTSVKGKSIKVWSVPEGVVTPNPEADAVPLKEDPV